MYERLRSTRPRFMCSGKLQHRFEQASLSIENMLLQPNGQLMGYYVDVGELDRNQRPILESQRRKAEIFADVSLCVPVYSGGLLDSHFKLCDCLVRHSTPLAISLASGCAFLVRAVSVECTNSYTLSRAPVHFFAEAILTGVFMSSADALRSDVHKCIVFVLIQTRSSLVAFFRSSHSFAGNEKPQSALSRARRQATALS